MTDNLIIFGAGDSTGSDIFGTPPLGNGLLSALQQFNPNIWNNIPSNLISSLTNDFEKGMEEISNNHSTALAPLQRSMAQYFFQFNPGTNNLYVKLAMKIISKNWDGHKYGTVYLLSTCLEANLDVFEEIITKMKESSKENFLGEHA